jgi:NADH-quinone oxidoreductase subunit N
VLLVMVGLTFKISAVPFHFWAPDVYEGSPTLITALMATLVKTAAFAALYRLFSTCFTPVTEIWTNVLWVISAATMLTGNILAVSQSSLKRMLAYSSISHAGYMLLAVISINGYSASALLMYTAAYSVASITSFALLHQISTQTGDESIEGMRGFARTNPVQAFILIITMLSMAGIPPLAGFFAKYYIFYAALQSGYIGLVLLAIISSLIGVYYYLHVVITIFQQPKHKPEPIAFNTGQAFLLVLTGLLTILLGVVPNLITSLLQ